MTAPTRLSVRHRAPPATAATPPTPQRRQRAAGVVCFAAANNTPTTSRRAVLLQQGSAALVAALAAQLSLTEPSQARQEPLNKEVDAADSPFIQELLKRSEEKKEERKKERLDAYYAKNFKDYFEFEGGSARAGTARGISSETQQAIARWLEANQ